LKVAARRIDNQRRLGWCQ